MRKKAKEREETGWAFRKEGARTKERERETIKRDNASVCPPYIAFVNSTPKQTIAHYSLSMLSAGFFY